MPTTIFMPSRKVESGENCQVVRKKHKIEAPLHSILFQWYIIDVLVFGQLAARLDGRKIDVFRKERGGKSTMWKWTFCQIKDGEILRPLCQNILIPSNFVVTVDYTPFCHHIRLFCAFWGKLNFTKKLKTRFFPHETRFLGHFAQILHFMMDFREKIVWGDPFHAIFC